MIRQWSRPTENRKVIEIASVTANSDALTVPMLVRASPPLASRVDVAIGPQPPPPMASSRPDTKPSTPTRRTSRRGTRRPSARTRISSASTSR